MASEFRHAERHIFGIGTYFTDLLDYVWYYAAEVENDNDRRKNFHKIPKLKESLSFVVSEIYYDKTQFDQVYDRNK